MNEELLVRADDAAAATLSHQREKIFDQEFEFRPSVDEALVGRIFHPALLALPVKTST